MEWTERREAEIRFKEISERDEKMKKGFLGSNVWNHIVLEGYCGYSWSKNKYTKTKEMKMLSNGQIDLEYLHSKRGWKTVKNRSYVNAKRPHTCRRSPNALCLESKCKFFLWTDVSKEVRIKEKKNRVRDRKLTRNK